MLKKQLKMTQSPISVSGKIRYLEGDGERGSVWNFLSFFSQDREEQLKML